MPLESATYISEMDADNPVHTDGLNQTDAHLRLLKTVLQSSFPAVTAAVTATTAQLNNAGGASTTTGVLDVPQQSSTVGAKVSLNTANGTGGDVSFQNTASAAASGVLTAIIGDSANANPHNVLTSDYTGNVAALASLNAPSVKKAGNELLPTGIIVMWSGASSAIPAGYFLCDGANGTPDLRGRFIIGAAGSYSVGATGGAASVTPTSSSDGTHSHSGTTGAAGGHTPVGVTDAQGSHSHGGQTQDHSLVLSEIPGHSHGLGGQSVVTDTFPSSNVNKANTGPGGGFSYTVASTDGGNGPHSHPISTDGTHLHNFTANAVPNHQHSIGSDGAHTHTVTVAVLPPYYALCFIMKS